MDDIALKVDQEIGYLCYTYQGIEKKYITIYYDGYGGYDEKFNLSPLFSFLF